MPKITLKNDVIVEISQESYDAFVKASEIIRVPDCIKIEFIYNQYYLNNGNMSLSAKNKNSLYKIECSSATRERPCKLVKCERGDLKRGYVAFRTDGADLSYSGQLNLYCIILDDERHVYWDDDNALVSDYSCTCWYKVVAI